MVSPGHFCEINSCSTGYYSLDIESFLSTNFKMNMLYKKNAFDNEKKHLKPNKPNMDSYPINAI